VVEMSFRRPLSSVKTLQTGRKSDRLILLPHQCLDYFILD
jgi:hypothetical protein